MIKSFRNSFNFWIQHKYTLKRPSGFRGFLISPIMAFVSGMLVATIIVCAYGIFKGIFLLLTNTEGFDAKSFLHMLWYSLSSTIYFTLFFSFFLCFLKFLLLRYKLEKIGTSGFFIGIATIVAFVNMAVFYFALKTNETPGIVEYEFLWLVVQLSSNLASIMGFKIFDELFES